MKNDYIKGMKAAVPIIMGYLPIGLAFGILAVQQGITVIQIFFMSLLVYAGSSQFIAASMIALNSGIFAITMTTFLVNLRHLLMSASMAPYLKHITSPILSLISYGITDETFAVSINQLRKETTSAQYMFGLHISSQTGWILSTVLGGIIGDVIPDPARWGMDFALNSMFIGLLLMQLKSKKELIVSLCAGALSIIIALNIEGNWNVILAAIVAATIGVWLEQWIKKSYS